MQHDEQNRLSAAEQGPTVAAFLQRPSTERAGVLAQEALQTPIIGTPTGCRFAVNLIAPRQARRFDQPEAVTLTHPAMSIHAHDSQEPYDGQATLTFVQDRRSVRATEDHVVMDRGGALRDLPFRKSRECWSPPCGTGSPPGGCVQIGWIALGEQKHRRCLALGLPGKTGTRCVRELSCEGVAGPVPELKTRTGKGKVGTSQCEHVCGKEDEDCLQPTQQHCLGRTPMIQARSCPVRSSPVETAASCVQRPLWHSDATPRDPCVCVCSSPVQPFRARQLTAPSNPSYLQLPCFCLSRRQTPFCLSRVLGVLLKTLLLLLLVSPASAVDFTAKVVRVERCSTAFSDSNVREALNNATTVLGSRGVAPGVSFVFTLESFCDQKQALDAAASVFSGSEDVVISLAPHGLQNTFSKFASLYKKPYVSANVYMAGQDFTVSLLPSYDQAAEVLGRFLTRLQWQGVNFVVSDDEFWLAVATRLHVHLAGMGFSVGRMMTLTAGFTLLEAEEVLKGLPRSSKGRWLGLSVCLSACQYVSLSVSLSVCLSPPPPPPPTSPLSVSLFLCLCLSACLSACLSVFLSLPACLPACLPVCLSVCLSLSLSLTVSLLPSYDQAAEVLGRFLTRLQWQGVNFVVSDDEFWLAVATRLHVHLAGMGFSVGRLLIVKSARLQRESQ